MYIIERNIDRDVWSVMLPEWRDSEYGTKYLVYEYDAAPSLYDALELAYHHRAAYSNWDYEMALNGKVILYTRKVDDDITIKFTDHSEISILETDKNGTMPLIISSSKENK
jgi:hypothetical protein